jgi:hypothetical protein
VVNRAGGGGGLEREQAPGRKAGVREGVGWMGDGHGGLGFRCRSTEKGEAEEELV